MPQTTRLRILQTTDLHMHLLPFDYGTLQPAPNRGLTALQGQIAQLRDHAGPTLLIDTGDFLQGTALGDQAAEGDGPHPMIAAFNAMGYDAVVLGNHDFDYDIPVLRRALAGLSCPALAANLRVAGGTPLAQDSALITRTIGCIPLNIGVMGLTVAPPPTVTDPHLPEHVIHHAPEAVARAEVEKLRNQGADIIVAACHFGIGEDAGADNSAQHIAQIAGVDAVLTGHTHDTFPGPDIPAGLGIDPVNGTLFGVPAVMAHAFGQAIGKIDLDIEHDGTGWQVMGSQVAIIRPDPSPGPHDLPLPGFLKLHDTAVAALKTPLAQTQVPMSTAFSMIAPDASQALLAQSRADHIRALLRDTPQADVPVLGSASPHRAGTKDAPTAFLQIAPGPITAQDAAAMFPFRDPLVGLAQDGAALRQWLETAGARFRKITPGQTQQPLIDPAVAPYDFKTLFGLTYRYDLSKPVGTRVVDLCYRGQPIKPDDRFVVATTTISRTYTAAAAEAEVLYQSTETSQDILRAYLRGCGPITRTEARVWNFVPFADTAAQFTTTRTADPALTQRAVTPGPEALDGLRMFTLHFR